MARIRPTTQDSVHHDDRRVAIAAIISIVCVWQTIGLVLSAKFVTHEARPLVTAGLLLGVTAVTFVNRSTIRTTLANPFHTWPTGLTWSAALVLSIWVAVAATLFPHKDRGPWAHLLDGVSGPHVQLPETLWPATFLAVLVASAHAFRRVLTTRLEP